MTTSDYEIEDVDAFLIDTLYMLRDAESKSDIKMPYAFLLTVLNKELQSLITVIEPFGMNGDPDREDAPQILGALGYHTINSLVINAPDVLTEGAGFISTVLHPDLATAERWTANIQEGIDVHKTPTFGMLATNGTEWSDISTGRTGSIPLGMTTPFETFNVLNENKAFGAEEFEFLDILDMDDDD